LKYIFVFLSLFIFLACSSKVAKPIKTVPEKKILLKVENSPVCEDLPSNIIEKISSTNIYDLKNIPQDISLYSKEINSNISIYDIQKKYEKYYFSMWNTNKPKEDLKAIKWPFATYCVGKSYGENLQLLKKSFFDEMYENSNFSKYATLNLKAITLKETDIRAFPTIKPLLRDPKQAGEGFPFDYMQNSTVHANKPILLSHYSKDKEWAYIFTSFTSGWIKTSELVILDKKHTNYWQKAQQVKITKEDIPIHTASGKFLFKSKIGMMFALIEEDKKTYTILTVSSYKDSKPLFEQSKILKTIASRNLLKLDDKNLNNIINEVSKTNYGWGGIYNQRDCSSMLRDLYAPFGIWLPRNSYRQSLVGKVISLKNLNDKEKIKLIKTTAIPFQTLLYKKGHIVLYVGTYDDEIIIFHNTWGIKTMQDGVEGRVVIGKPVLSTLRLGSHQKHYDENSEILKNLKSMNILTR